MDGRQQGSTKLKVYGAVVFTTRSCTATSRGPPTDVTKSSSPLTPPIPQDTPQHTLEGYNQQSPTVKFCSNMPASLPSFARPKLNGHVMSLACLMIASQSSCSTESSAKASALLVASASDSRTASGSL